MPVTQSKCTNHSNFYCWGAGSFPSIMLMVAESMHFQLKCNNMTGPLDCKEKCLSSSEQHTWGQASLLPPACCSRSVSPKPKHKIALRVPRGTGRPSTFPEYQPSPMGIHDLHLRSTAFCFHCLQLLFKSKLDQK